jgi:hypothetical protein
VFFRDNVKALHDTEFYRFSSSILKKLSIDGNVLFPSPFQRYFSVLWLTDDKAYESGNLLLFNEIFFPFAHAFAFP